MPGRGLHDETGDCGSRPAMRGTRESSSASAFFVAIDLENAAGICYLCKKMLCHN